MAGYEELLPVVRTAVGELSPDEYATYYGMASAVADLGWGLELTPFDARAAGEAFVAFRLRACPFCGRGLVDHALDVDRPGVMVRCRTDDSARPAGQWLAGPDKTPESPVLLWSALWVGIPVLSLGLLSWLMPVVSAVVLRTRRWVWGAVLWGVLTIVDFVVVAPRVPISEELTLASGMV